MKLITKELEKRFAEVGDQSHSGKNGQNDHHISV